MRPAEFDRRSALRRGHAVNVDLVLKQVIMARVNALNKDHLCLSPANSLAPYGTSSRPLTLTLALALTLVLSSRCHPPLRDLGSRSGLQISRNFIFDNC